MSELHDLSCVVHVHSTHSDGTGTVAEIAAAGIRTGADVVLVTDHNSIGARRAGEEGWYDGRRGRSLVLVGQEVTPPGRNHLLAFGLDERIDRRLAPAEFVARVRERGGFGYAAHPFSEGSERFPGLSSLGVSMAFDDLSLIDGVELWSFLADNGQSVGSIRGALWLLAHPQSYVRHPPQGNLDRWDELTRRRRVHALAGLDAHQFGLRIGGRVLRAMGYARSFAQLRTHLLVARPLSGELEHDRELVLSALRAGRAYIAAHAVAPARGFRLHAERDDGVRAQMGEQAPPGGWTIHARLPLAANVRLLRDGRQVAAREAVTALEHRAEEPGAYRLEATRRSWGASRTWLLSNPIYLR